MPSTEQIEEDLYAPIVSELEKQDKDIEEKDRQIEKFKLKIKRLKGRFDLSQQMLSDVRLLVKMLKGYKGLV